MRPLRHRVVPSSKEELRNRTSSSLLLLKEPQAGGTLVNWDGRLLLKYTSSQFKKLWECLRISHNSKGQGVFISLISPRGDHDQVKHACFLRLSPRFTSDKLYDSWTNYLTSLSLYFLFFEMDEIMSPHGHYEK